MTRTFAIALTFSLFVGCGATRTSMINYASLREDRSARLYADGDWLVMITHDPMGMTLVTYAPWLNGERVVLNGGLSSSGAEAERIHCFDVGALHPASGWQQRVYWHDSDGAFVPVGEIQEGPEAAAYTAQCRAH